MTIKWITKTLDVYDDINDASAFVERNPAQIYKEMRSGKHEEMPVVICFNTDMASGLEHSLASIARRRAGKTGSVLVLGRHNFDIEIAYPGFKDEDSYSTERISLKRDHKTGDVRIEFAGCGDVTFMSVHRAKGLEADDVIVLNLTNGMYGFPNRVEDDPILRVLLGGDDAFKFAEERRLFYVAITRTRNNTYLVSGSMESGGGPSPFIEEPRSHGSGHIGIFRRKGEDLQHPVLCPRCGTGRLVVRKSSQSGKSFLGCTNYPFCEKSYDQTEIVKDKVKCPSCGGWMVRQRRRDGGKPFFGCSNYPKCSAAIDATEDYKPTYAPPKPKPRSQSQSTSSFHRNSSHSASSSSSKCPQCGAPLKLLKNSKDGSDFYGCTRYPSCRYTCSAEISQDRASASMKCPKCGSTLKELTNKKDGSVFYGCIRHPKCKYTRGK